MKKREHPRTILLIRNAAKQDFGGAETYPVSLAKILAQNGLTPIIVTRSEKLTSYARSHKVKTIRGWWWSKQTWNGQNIALFPAYLAWQCALTMWYMLLIIKTRPLALHIQSKDDFIGATIAGKIMRVRTVWTDHMDLRYIFQNIKKPLRNPLGKLVFWAAKRADKIIIISDNEHRLVTAELPNWRDLDHNIMVIKNGVIDELQNIQKKKTNSVFTFCLTNRLVTYKGIGDAIEAFSIVSKKLAGADKRVRLVFYGDGPEADKFKKLASGIEGIEFYGHTEDAIQKVSEADVFIHPSYHEGFSISLLEAVMLGKPMIVTDVDSNPEVVKHKETGLLVPAKNPKKLAEAMLLLINNPELKQTLGLNARKNYEQNFNLETIVREKIIPLYD